MVIISIINNFFFSFLQIYKFIIKKKSTKTINLENLKEMDN